MYLAFPNHLFALIVLCSDFFIHISKNRVGFLEELPTKARELQERIHVSVKGISLKRTQM